MKIIYWLCSVLTGIIGYQINDGSFGWAILDSIFWVFSWAKWLICHDVNMTIIHQSFAWFLQ